MGHLRAEGGRRGKVDEAEMRAATAQRHEIERLARLNQVEQQRFATMTRAKSERQEAAAQRLQAKQAELIANARLKGQHKREHIVRVQARAQSARAKQQEDAMNLAESIRSERRVRQPLPCTMHLRAQRSRRAKGPLASTLERPQHRPLATKHTVKPSLPTKPARPHTAPEALGRQQRRKQAEPPTSPGFHNFRPREAPPMPALSSEELERLGLRAKQECGVCLRQYLLSNLPGVTTRRAITRLRENWVKELGTAEPVNVDVRTSKPAQYYSEVRLCVFCYQFVRSGLNDGPDNDQTASPPTARLNGSPLPARYGRHRPRLGDRNLLAVTSAAPTAQAKATAAAVEEAVLQAERMAEQRRIVNKQQPRILSETNVVTSSMGAQFGSLGRKRRWRVDAQRPQQRSDEYRSTRRSLQAKLFTTPTPPRSASSATSNCDLTYRRGVRRPSLLPERRSPKKKIEQLDDLVSRATAAQEKDEPEVVSSLLLKALKLAPENNELAKLQAKAAMAAKARARVDEEERQTARWMQRLSYTEHELDKRSKMLATTSVEVDLFMSKTTKIIELQVESPEQSKRLFELIAQKKATGEIAADQDFRLISAADAVVKRKKEAKRTATEEAKAHNLEAEEIAANEEAARMNAAEDELSELVGTLVGT